MNCNLQLLINGKPYPVGPDLTPKTSLLNFIRDHAVLSGTKSMCKEGGCGACVVALKIMDPTSGQGSYHAVNSCLFPALSALGSEVITIEGLGDRNTGYHQIQKRLAKFNGTQCGYCTPGMVMNMFSLLEDNPKITMKEVEKSFGGNICRCTGYRPILDAFKSLTVDATENLKHKIPDIEELVQCEKRVCPVKSCPQPPKIIASEFGTWHRPASIRDIIALLHSIGDNEYMLVGGNTAHGVYRTTGNPRHFIDINGVTELKICRDSGTHLELGGGITLTNAIRIFETHAKGNLSYLKTLRKHFELIANVPVRNVGTLAGNLATKHKYPEFSSDIFIILETVGAKIVLESEKGERTITLVEFLAVTLHKTIIKRILLPKKGEQYKIRTFKIMPRAQNVPAYVNAGFQFKVDKGVVLERPTMVFGGISSAFIHAKKCEAHFGNAGIINNDTLRQGLQILNDEIQPEIGSLKSSVEHRRSLAVSLFYKYILGIASSNLSDRLIRGSLDLERPLSAGTQGYGYVNENWPKNNVGPKIESIIQCSGEAEYVNDIPPMPGQLFAAFVLGQEANAILLEINAKKALEEPGVVAFFSAKDIPGQNVFVSRGALYYSDEELFCSGRVLHGGQPVGVVVAESQDLALRAAQLVELKTRSAKEPPILTCRQALKRNKLDRITEFHNRKSDESKIDECRIKHEITGEHELGPQYHFTMEPQSCVCVPTDVGLDVFSSTQWIHGTQLAISKLLNIPLNKINLKVKRLGGGFGSKITRSFMVATACSLAAVKLNRPVRMILNIESNMEAIGKRNPAFCSYKVSTDEHGKIIRLSLDFYSDVGINTNDPSHYLILNGLNNIYDTSTWEVRVSTVKTDTPSCCYTRAPGTLEGVSAIETVMDHIAAVTGQDPLNVRMINRNLEDKAISDTILSLVSSSNYTERRQAVQNFNSKNRWFKKGVAFHSTVFPLEIFFNYHASVSIYVPDGSVSITHGGVEMGQGINTKVAQACAYTLGIDLNMVSIQPTNNHDSPNNAMSGGSVTSESCVFATTQCCQSLLERLRPIREIVGKDASWAELIKKAYVTGVDLNASYQFTPSSLPIKSYNTYGASVIEVELDVLTGKYQIVRADL